MKIDHTKVHYAQEYSHLEGKNLSGREVVIWGHPDIPMYVAELILDEQGGFLNVGKTLSKAQVHNIIGKENGQ